MIPAFVTNFERVEWPKKLCASLALAGLEPIIVDTGSKSDEVAQFYNETPFRVERCKIRRHSRAAWEEGLVKRLAKDFYIVTDNDLDISMLPADWVDVLKEGLAANFEVTKAALSLETNGIVNCELSKKVADTESKWWARRASNGFFFADTDTTLALYDIRKGGMNDEMTGWLDGAKFYDSVRSDRPYTAKHLPWHERTDECRRYEAAVTDCSTFWTDKFKKGELSIA